MNLSNDMNLAERLNFLFDPMDDDPCKPRFK